MFRSYASLDKSSRLKKAEKIIKIISKYKNIHNSRILDIGCGSGYLGSILSKKSKYYIGIDFVDERKVKNFHFLRCNAVAIPFKNKIFDIVICNHVIEHVGDNNKQDKLLNEIYRLLKDDGICYITSPNKLWPIEPHLKLPFLSLLPRKIADAYVKAAGKGAHYDIYPMTYIKFKRKLDKLFSPYNFTLEVLKNPRDYGFDKKIYKIFSVSKYLPLTLLEVLNYFLPNWIIILRKKPFRSIS